MSALVAEPRLEAKLLKTGMKYKLGRKTQQLVVNHKKVSHDHSEFLVGTYTQDDVVCLVFPTLVASFKLW